MDKFSLNLRKIVVTTWLPNLMDWKTKLVVGGSSCRWHKTVRLTFVLNAVNYIRLTLLIITFFINFIILCSFQNQISHGFSFAIAPNLKAVSRT